MIRPAVVLSAAAVLVAGCGGSKTETVTQVQTVAQQPTETQTTATVPKIQIQTPTTPPSGGSGSGGSGGSLSQAEARVSAEGYNVDNAGDYDSSHTLRVLVGTRKDSGDGYAKRAFFFVGGRYLGTDTSDDSAGVRVEGSDNDTVTLAYALYGQGDALCCPGGTARVRYRWNGSRLVPLDPIPSRSQRG